MNKLFNLWYLLQIYVIIFVIKEQRTIEAYYLKSLYGQQEYEKIINDVEVAINNGQELSNWDYFYYALSLNRFGKTADAIEIFKKLKLNSFINTCVDECIINWIASEYFSIANAEKYKQDERIEQFEFIFSNYKYSEIPEKSRSCFNYMLLKVCKQLNILPTNTDSRKVIEIITSVNFDDFSEEERVFKDEDKDRVYFSEKEALYSNIIKAYWNLKEYNLCSQYCQSALTIFDGRLHHKNNIWFRQKQLICDIRLKIERNEEYSEDLKTLKSICSKSKHFSSYKHLGDVYELIDIDMALSAYSEAYLYGYDIKELHLKLGILKEIAMICENKNNFFIAKQCYALMIKLRKENNWDIKRELQSKADLYSITDDMRIRYNEIINFCVNNLSKQKYLIGQVIQNNKIVCSDYKGKIIFFSNKDILNYKFFNPKYINGSIVAFKFADFKTGKAKSIYIGARLWKFT